MFAFGLGLLILALILLVEGMREAITTESFLTVVGSIVAFIALGSTGIYLIGVSGHV